MDGLRWIPKRVHHTWVLGDVVTASGRTLEMDVALDEACEMYPEVTFTVSSKDYRDLAQREMIP